MNKFYNYCFMLLLSISFCSASGLVNPDTSVDVSFFTGNLTNLSEMADVNIPTPTNEQVLSYDSTTTKWIARTISSLAKWVIDTSNGFFYTSGNTLYFNDTLLNDRIDDRAVTTETDPIYTSENTTIARTGDCPSGQVVANITTGGVECIIAAGDITSVQGDNIYIYNGSDSGNVNLAFNETKLNSSVEAFGYITSFSETDPYWTANQSSYSTTSEILAFGYYNSSDFVITDYFTKSDILGFNYYNSTDFSISDYLTSSEVLAFNYYNSSDFNINDYFTSAQVLGFGYYNSSDFVISNYYTKANIESFSYYNSSDFVISDYATNVKVDSLGNFSAYVQPTHLTNFTDDLGNRGYTSNLNFTNGAGYYNLSDFDIGDYYLLSNPYGYYNSTTMPSYILTSDEGNLDVNSSDYWDSYDVASDLNNLIEIAGENITSGTIGYARLPTLDYLVLVKWANITDAPTVLSFFTDDLGDRGYTHLTNFTDDLGNRGYTHLSNFSNDLGIGNWSADSSNYYNTTETDAQIENANTSMKTYVDGTFITQANEGNLNVNSSDYWDDLSSTNTTWFQNVAGALSLKLSQLTTWTDTWLGTKDTDDLSEGSTNLYDNRSWNESGANNLYVNVDGDTMTGDLNMGNNNILNVNTINITNNTYVDYLRSSNGNSIYVLPSGDVDDSFSFKTIANRPTIKREGGKYVYFESSNVYDVGISFRQSDTYSGTLNYEKDNHVMTMLGKNSPIGFKANSEYLNYILFETYDHQPQISVFNGTTLLVNDSLEVNGIVNATGKVYSEGVEVLTSYSDTNASTACFGSTTYLDGEGNCDDISSVYAPVNYGDDWNKTYADTLYRLDSWDNITGIPHATPSDGDTTHFSLADEIYDWVIGLGYATTTYVDNLVGSVGNWSNDKSSYWNTSTDLDTVISDDEISEGKIEFTTACSAGDYYRLNGNDLECTTPTDSDTNLTEDDVEAYIFDNDNTNNLNMSGYNITSVDYMKFEGGGYMYDNGTILVIGRS